jgi:hypothetical protein
VDRHGREHRLDERLLDDRRSELDAVAGVLAGLPIGRFRDPDGLCGDAEARVVHEIEHRAEALAALAEEEGFGVLELHDARGRAVDPHLVLHPAHPDAVLLAVVEDTRAEHQRQPVRRAAALVERRRVAREDEVHCRAAVRDEDLLAVDEPAAVLLRHARDDAAEIGSGLRLGQVHRALQLARREPRQVLLLELLGAVFLDVLSHAGLQAEDRHEARLGAREHLEDVGVHEHRQRVAAILGAQGQAHDPRTLQPLVAGRDVRRDDDLTVLEAHGLFPMVAGVGFDVLADLGRGLPEWSGTCRARPRRRLPRRGASAGSAPNRHDGPERAPCLR